MPESRLKDKAKDVVQEHPYATGAAATGTAVLGAKYGRLARAGYSLRKLKQGDRAARLARDMAPSRSGNVGMDPLAQQKAHLALKRKNSDLRYVKPTAERWSKTFKNASRIKSADPDKKVRVAEAVFRPGEDYGSGGSPDHRHDGERLRAAFSAALPFASPRCQLRR